MKMNAQQLITAYQAISIKIKEQQKVLAEMRKEEKLLTKELCEWLNQTETEGFKIDDKTVLVVVKVDKKISKSKKEYKAYLSELYSSSGSLTDEQFVNAVMAGKIDSVVQQQKIKFVKTK